MRLYLPLLIAGILLAQNIWAGNAVDSLQRELRLESDEYNKAKIKVLLAYEYTFEKPDSAYIIYEELIDFALAYDHHKLLMVAFTNYAFDKMSAAQYEEALDILEAGMTIAETKKDSAYQCEFLNIKGLTLWNKGELTKATILMVKGLELAKTIGQRDLIASITNNLGILYDEINDPDKAIKYYLEGLSISIENKDSLSIGLGYMNTGQAYLVKEDSEKSIAYFIKAKPFIEWANTDKISTIFKLNLSAAYIVSKQFKKAEKLYLECSAFAKKSEDPELILYSLATGANLYSEIGDIDKGTEYGQKAITLTKKLELPKYNKDLFEILARNYESKGFYKESLKWYKKSVVLNDSLYNLDKERQIQEVEAAFQFREKDAENQLLKLQSENLQAESAQKNIVNWALGIGIFLLACFFAQSIIMRRKQILINENLEKIVAQRTADLRKTNEHLSTSNEELKRFAYIASHDLKEPLRNIGSFVSLMKRRIERGQFDDLMEYITYTQNSTTQMTKLVEDILEYSKITQRDTVEIKQVDLNIIIERIEILLTGDLKNRNAKIHYGHLPAVIFNRSLIMMVIKNLVENGLKYNRSEVPEINISHSDMEDHIEILIEDNGIGIEEQYQERIFEMFTRLHDRETFDGSGMGLALCKKIMKLYGGDIWVNSVEGKGSKFYISIPKKINLSTSDLKEAAHLLEEQLN